MGLVINNQLYDLFYKIITNVKIDESKKKYNDFTQEEKTNMGISYNKLLLNFIMAFQEFHKKFKNEYEKQKILMKK